MASGKDVRIPRAEGADDDVAADSMAYDERPSSPGARASAAVVRGSVAKRCVYEAQKRSSPEQ